MLAHLLRMAGIETIVLEARPREYCETRIRAGLMEQGFDLMDQVGAGERLHREALVHRGIYLRFKGHSQHIDIHGTTGRSI
jgi:p-hydroxybenzoate 3-monooxygenase